MANNLRPASTPRIARMLREPEGPPSGIETGVSARLERGDQHRIRRRAGRRLLVGLVVMAGVALAVATDFLQFRAMAGHANPHQMAASVVSAGHVDGRE